MPVVFNMFFSRVKFEQYFLNLCVGSAKRSTRKMRGTPIECAAANITAWRDRGASEYNQLFKLTF